MAQNSSELEPLVFDAKKELQQKLMRFLNEKVFIEDDDGMPQANIYICVSLRIMICICKFIMLV
jgi:hypothetical protein